MHTIKKLKRTIVFILKLALFASLFGIFFGIFGINNPWLFNLSRTTGVTMVTFVVLGIGGAALGGLAVGQAGGHFMHSQQWISLGLISGVWRSGPKASSIRMLP